MRETEWSTMPMVICPHCKKEFRLDDYYDYDTGDSFDCHNCEKEIHILQKDLLIEVNLGIHPE